MTILPMSPDEALKLTSSPDSELVQELCSPSRKKTAKEVLCHKRVSEKRLQVDKTIGKKPELDKRKDAFSQLLEHSKSSGAEMFQPDKDTFVVKTNIPGYSLHFKRSPTGDVEITLKNGKGQILSSDPSAKSPEDLQKFMFKEGLSYSKNTAPDRNLSSSSLYRETEGYYR